MQNNYQINQIIDQENLEAENKAHLDNIISVKRLNHNLFASCSKDETIKIWDWKNKLLLKSFKNDKFSDILVKSQNLLFANSDNLIIAINWKTLQLEDIYYYNHSITYMEVYKNNYLIIGDYKGNIQVLQYGVEDKTGEWNEIAQINNPLKQQKVTYIYVLQQKNMQGKILVGYEFGNICLIDIETMEVCNHYQGHDENTITYITLNPVRPNTFLSSGEDKTVRCWDISTGAPLKKIVLQNPILTCILLENQNEIAVADNSVLRIFNLSTWKYKKIENQQNNQIQSVENLNQGTLLLADIQGNIQIFNQNQMGDFTYQPENDIEFLRSVNILKIPITQRKDEIELVQNNLQNMKNILFETNKQLELGELQINTDQINNQHLKQNIQQSQSIDLAQQNITSSHQQLELPQDQEINNINTGSIIQNQQLYQNNNNISKNMQLEQQFIDNNIPTNNSINNNNNIQSNENINNQQSQKQQSSQFLLSQDISSSQQDQYTNFQQEFQQNLQEKDTFQLTQMTENCTKFQNQQQCSQISQNQSQSSIQSNKQQQQNIEQEKQEQQSDQILPQQQYYQIEQQSQIQNNSQNQDKNQDQQKENIQQNVDQVIDQQNTNCQQCKSYQIHIQLLSKEINRQNTQMDQKDTKLRQFVQDYSDLQSKFEKNESQLKQLVQMGPQLQSSYDLIHDLQMLLEEKTKEIQFLHKNFDDQAIIIQNLNKENSMNQTSLVEDLQQKIKILETKNQDLFKDNSNLITNYNILQQQNDQAKQKINELQQLSKQNQNQQQQQIIQNKATPVIIQQNQKAQNNSQIQSLDKKNIPIQSYKTTERSTKNGIFYSKVQLHQNEIQQQQQQQGPIKNSAIKGIHVVQNKSLVQNNSQEAQNKQQKQEISQSENDKIRHKRSQSSYTIPKDNKQNTNTNTCTSTTNIVNKIQFQQKQLYF